MNPETLYHVHKHVVPAALALLPGTMDSLEARAMLLAVGLQESGFAARVQGGGGPAHGYWQFERGGGVKEVLTNPGTQRMIVPALHVLNYSPDIVGCYAAIVHNDVLACVFARLLLWTVPGRLPGISEAPLGWQQYLAGWRPGKPHPKTWGACFEDAWRTVVQE